MTEAEFAILSLIVEKPRHGYDIEQEIKLRGMREWTDIGFSSIYYLLNKLEKANLIKSQLHQPKGKGPARKVYSVTESGRKEHLQSLIRTLSIPPKGAAPLLLGLSNASVIPREQLLVALNTYIQELDSRLEALLNKSASQQDVSLFVDAMFGYSKTMIEGERNWIQNFIHDLEVGNV